MKPSERVDWLCDYLASDGGSHGEGTCPPSTWTADFDCENCGCSIQDAAVCWRLCCDREDGRDATWLTNLRDEAQQVEPLRKALAIMAETAGSGVALTVKAAIAAAGGEPTDG